MNSSREFLRNKLKIVSNRNPKSLSFFLMNEKGRWMLVSNYSDLSRKDSIDPDIFMYPTLVTPSAVLSGKELAKALNFPTKSVRGRWAAVGSAGAGSSSFAG